MAKGNPLQEQLLKAGLVKKSKVSAVAREQHLARHAKAGSAPGQVGKAIPGVEIKIDAPDAGGVEAKDALVQVQVDDAIDPAVALVYAAHERVTCRWCSFVGFEWCRGCRFVDIDDAGLRVFITECQFVQRGDHTDETLALRYARDESAAPLLRRYPIRTRPAWAVRQCSTARCSA